MKIMENEIGKIWKKEGNKVRMTETEKGEAFVTNMAVLCLHTWLPS